MMIQNRRMAHSHGVAEWMYEHAEIYGCSDRDGMYLLGLLHDIGYMYGEQSHELSGAMMLGMNSDYGKLIQAHGMTPKEYSNFCNCPEADIPKELILLWVADMMVSTVTGEVVGFKKRLKEIELVYGTRSRKYRAAKETMDWVEEWERQQFAA